MRLPENPVIPIMVILAAIILQVFIPALFDIVVSIAVAGGGFLLGHAVGRRA